MALLIRKGDGEHLSVNNPDEPDVSDEGLRLHGTGLSVEADKEPRHPVRLNV